MVKTYDSGNIKASNISHIHLPQKLHHCVGSRGEKGMRFIPQRLHIRTLKDQVVFMCLPGTPAGSGPCRPWPPPSSRPPPDLHRPPPHNYRVRDGVKMQNRLHGVQSQACAGTTPRLQNQIVHKQGKSSVRPLVHGCLNGVYALFLRRSRPL